MRQMKTAELLEAYEDGNATGWPAEFAWLWTEQPSRMLELVTDIAARGITDPVMLGTDGSVWDGHHRIAAAVALGLESVPVATVGEIVASAQEAVLETLTSQVTP